MRGWQGVIIGLVIVLLVWSIFVGVDMDEANNIRENGFLYSGTSNVTVEEFEYIKKYDGFHSGTVEIVSVEPLTVEYNFGALERLDYLNHVEWPASEKFKNGLGYILLYLSIGIGLAFMLRGFLTIGKRERKKDEKTEEGQ